MMHKFSSGQASVEVLVVGSALLAIWLVPIPPLEQSLVHSVLEFYQRWHGFYEWVWRHYALIPGMQL